MSFDLGDEGFEIAVHSRHWRAARRGARRGDWGCREAHRSSKSKERNGKRTSDQQRCHATQDRRRSGSASSPRSASSKRRAISRGRPPLRRGARCPPPASRSSSGAGLDRPPCRSGYRRVAPERASGASGRRMTARSRAVRPAKTIQSSMLAYLFGGEAQNNRRPLAGKRPGVAVGNAPVANQW